MRTVLIKAVDLGPVAVVEVISDDHVTLRVKRRILPEGVRTGGDPEGTRVGERGGGRGNPRRRKYGQQACSGASHADAMHFRFLLEPVRRPARLDVAILPVSQRYIG